MAIKSLKRRSKTKTEKIFACFTKQGELARRCRIGSIHDLLPLLILITNLGFDERSKSQKEEL